MNEEYKIKGWVASDYDKTPMLYTIKPHRLITGVWCGGKDYFPLDKNIFPELTWNDEPIEVELTIKKV